MSPPRDVPLASIAAVDSGPAFKSAHFRPSGEGVPLLRGDNIEPGSLRWARTKTWPRDMLGGYEHLLVQEDDLILGMDRPIISSGLKLARVTRADLPALLVQRVARIRPTDVDARYLYYWLSSNQFASHLQRSATGTQLPHVTLASVREFGVPRFGAEAERHIVAVLEDHLSHLDAAESALRLTERRLKALVKSVLTSLIPDVAHYPTSWERSTVADAGAIELGRQRHPDWHIGPNMKPYLRVANVFEDRIDVRDVKEMHWPDATFERFKLHPGDVLLNEGQTPELLGRPALYRGEPAGVAFTNSLLRFKASDRVLPEFALLVFRRHMHAGRFTRESRITTNIAHLSASRLKPIEFPIPSRDDQQKIVDTAREQLENVWLLEAAVNAARGRSAGLRRSLLGAAFAGQLTGSATELSEVGEMIGA